MSSKTPNSNPNRFNWLWLVVAAAAFFLGRWGWGAMHPAPAPASAPAVAGASAAPAEEGPTHWVAVADAESRAKQAGKPILYDFNAAWCPPCRALKADVFSNASLAQQVETHVVPVTVVDRYREDGRNAPEIDALQQRFGIEAFPTLVVVSPTTGRFEKAEGYGGPEQTLAWIERAAASVGGTQ